MTNSPSLEVIASPVANFILLHKRNILSVAPHEQFYHSSWPSPKKEPKNKIYTFQAWVAIFTWCRMNTFSAAVKEPKDHMLETVLEVAVC